MLINYCCCQVSIIEFDIRKFIDDVFKTVRSAEVAFDTVVTFQHISTRDSVSAVMKTKFADVLDRYDKQVGTISSPSCWGEEGKPPLSFAECCTLLLLPLCILHFSIAIFS